MLKTEHNFYGRNTERKEKEKEKIIIIKKEEGTSEEEKKLISSRGANSFPSCPPHDSKQGCSSIHHRLKAHFLLPNKNHFLPLSSPLKYDSHILP